MTTIDSLFYLPLVQHYPALQTAFIPCNEFWRHWRCQWFSNWHTNKVQRICVSFFFLGCGWCSVAPCLAWPAVPTVLADPNHSPYFLIDETEEWIDIKLLMLFIHCIIKQQARDTPACLVRMRHYHHIIKLKNTRNLWVDKQFILQSDSLISTYTDTTTIQFAS